MSILHGIAILAMLLFLPMTLIAQSRISGGELLGKKVTAEFSSTPVSEVLSSLQKISGVPIVFPATEVSRLSVFTGKFQDEPISNILDSCLKSSRLSYTVVNKTIVIKSETHSDRITIFGTVKDENGLPLPGAGIQLKETNVGVASDSDGNYSIEFGRRPGKENVLVFSFIGMKTSEFSVSGSSSLNVVLESDSNLDEVVVNGFYSQPKSTFTGVATTIKGEDLISAAPTNLIAGIVSMTPGMVIVENNAQGSNPNAVPSLLIRGANSLITNESAEGVNNPLIVLDGVEISMAELYDLDVFDIERVDVLKDASATILYGEKGANGVIVIERKKTDDTKLRLNYNC